MPYSCQLRDIKGKFAKQKKINKSLNCVVAMNSAKREIKNKENNLNIGQRIVELCELGKNLKCCECKNVLSLEKIRTERRLGLDSILDIVCDECSVITQVSTGKIHVAKNNVKHPDVDAKAGLGAVHAGIGCTASNKLLMSMNIPAISTDLYKRYEREIGPAIEEAAKESCKHAAALERQLIIEKIQELKEKM